MNEMCRMSMTEFRTTVNRFKELCPELICWNITYEENGYMNIIIHVPKKGKLIFDYPTDSLKWIEEWTDEKELKQQEREMRPDMYNQFCDKVEQYMYDHRLTHQQFADMVGISRWSLSRYLNNERIPKVSTMRRICEAANIDI